jgi:hypothetical protein
MAGHCRCILVLLPKGWDSRYERVVKGEILLVVSQLRACFHAFQTASFSINVCYVIVEGDTLATLLVTSSIPEFKDLL